MEGKTILIVGHNSLQNELITLYLEKETAAKCFVVDNYAELASDPSTKAENDLVLYDCMGKEAEDCIEECAPLIEKQPAANLLCLFNLKKDTGMEEALVTQGARGFFYVGEPFQNLVKGVHAVLKGEFWVSRKIMTDLIEKSNQRTRKTGQGILSRREIDILTKIVEGATNEEIADKLCISTHTVKTHIYNIFKKINVNSRFHAALWAVKHL